MACVKSTLSKPDCLLSFDVEDWYHVENLREYFPPHTWESQESRVKASTYKILQMLDRFDARATFFILGWIADRNRQLVKDIANAGHEIASHGYGHVMPTRLSLTEMRCDLVRARELLEDITGQKVLGYRAPSYGIDDDRLQLVFETGHTYDSSHNPVNMHDRYGSLNCFEGEVSPGILQVKGGGLEVQLPVSKWGPFEVPISGGGWFRLSQAGLFRKLALNWARTHGHYIFYLHPWEFDPEQPRISKGVKLTNRFRHYVNIGDTARRLEMLMQEFSDLGSRFCTIGNYLDEIPVYVS